MKPTKGTESLLSKLKSKLTHREKPSPPQKSNGKTSQLRTDATTKISQAQSLADTDAASRPVCDGVVAHAETGYFEVDKQEEFETGAKKFASNVIEEVFERNPSLARENLDGDKKAIVATVTEITKSVVTTPGNLSLVPSREMETTKIEAKVRVEEETDSTYSSTTDVADTNSEKTTGEEYDIESILGPAVAKWHINLKARNSNQNGERYEIRIHRKGQTTPPATLPGGIIILPSGMASQSGWPSRSGSNSSRPSSTMRAGKKRGHA